MKDDPHLPLPLPLPRRPHRAHRGVLANCMRHGDSAVGAGEDSVVSYHCGIGPALAAALGRLPCEPHVKCDGCGAEKHINGRGAGGNIAPAWLLDNKAPPGWKLFRHEDGEMRADYCPNCKVGR